MPETSIAAATAQMVTALRRRYPNLPVADASRVVREELMRMVNEMLFDLYYRHFTHQEIREILAFAKTSAGEKFNREFPLLLQELPIKTQEQIPTLIARIEAALFKNGWVPRPPSANPALEGASASGRP